MLCKSGKVERVLVVNLSEDVFSLFLTSSQCADECVNSAKVHFNVLERVEVFLYDESESTVKVFLTPLLESSPDYQNQFGDVLVVASNEVDDLFAYRPSRPN